MTTESITYQVLFPDSQMDYMVCGHKVGILGVVEAERLRWLAYNYTGLLVA